MKTFCACQSDEQHVSLPSAFLEQRGIPIRDLPPAPQATSLALDAAARFRTGRHKLNLADCFHYACAKFHDVPILATAEEFRFTDLKTVP